MSCGSVSCHADHSCHAVGTLFISFMSYRSFMSYSRHLIHIIHVIRHGSFMSCPIKSCQFHVMSNQIMSYRSYKKHQNSVSAPGTINHNSATTLRKTTFASDFALQSTRPCTKVSSSDKANPLRSCKSLTWRH